MDERLGFIQDKMGCVLEFKDSATIDIANLKSHCEATKNDPVRIASLENWRSAFAACLALLAVLIGWALSLLKVL
jgi:hypothetical protein